MYARRISVIDDGITVDGRYYRLGASSELTSRPIEQASVPSSTAVFGFSRHIGGVRKSFQSNCAIRRDFFRLQCVFCAPVVSQLVDGESSADSFDMPEVELLAMINVSPM